MKTPRHTEMTAELKNSVARAIIANCRRNGASDADIGVILSLALFDHLDELTAKYGPYDNLIDGMIFALQLRKHNASHNNNPLTHDIVGRA